MRKGLAAAFAAFMLLFAAGHLLLFAGNLALKREIVDLKGDLALETAKMRKQQAEYDDYAARLPAVKEELGQIQPKAEEMTRWVEAMRAERRALRRQIQSDQAALEAIETMDYSALQSEAEALMKTREALEDELAAYQTAQE